VLLVGRDLNPDLVDRWRGLPVRWVGVADDLARVFEDAAALVLSYDPSTETGTPLKVTDAIAHGVPVVATTNATAPLGLVEGLDRTFVAMNGDVLTTLPYDGFIRHHRRNRNIVTIATRVRTLQIDYGVLYLGGNGRRNQVASYDEKPQITATVSMGIYAVEPEALAYIPRSGRFDFPDLVKALLRAGEKVGVYRHDGLWFDIGRRDDYEEAVAAWAEAPAPAVALRAVSSAASRGA
jgi:NDP-sugar pyrophosphorylase family protein